MLRDGPAQIASRAASEKNSATSFWYAATVASKFGLDLEDVAVANLTEDR
jgi:hypothetical protein